MSINNNFIQKNPKNKKAGSLTSRGIIKMTNYSLLDRILGENEE
jgi:hypothetical protein